jgi:myo-inositol-1(or 4)-monophosphatase
MARRISGVGLVTVSERRSTSTTVTVRYNWRVAHDDPAGRLDADTVAQVFGTPADGPDPLLTELATVALTAARAATAVLVNPRTGTPGGVETKTSATDMVSDVDREAEAAVSEVLARLRPEDAVLGEEGTTRDGTTAVRWVVDPLDGTTNFLFGIPQFSVSVAAELDGEPAVGVVVHPSHGETWAARRGGGARLNGLPCRVASGRSSLATALVATGFGYQSVRREWQAEVARKVIPSVRDIRRFGSAALDLCWTAGGRYDAYYEWGLNPWDLAAGALICREAGGRVEALPGRLIVAAPPDLFDPLCELLASAGGLDAPPGSEPVFW